MPKAHGPPYLPARLMLPARIDQAAPVQNTWYTVLDTTLNVIVYTISVRVETTGETLEARITADGNVYTTSIAAVAATTYWIIAQHPEPNLPVTASDYSGVSCAAQYFTHIEARSIKVEVRKTTAAGAGNLRARVNYGVW